MSDERGVDQTLPVGAAAQAASLGERLARLRGENLALLRRVEESERRFRRISRGVLRLQEEERSRLSRDLHDGIGQVLTALRTQLELLEQEAARSAPLLSPRFASVREMAEGCLREVRQLTRVLRPAMLDDLGIVPALRWFVRTFHQQTGILVLFTCEGEERRLDPDVETLLYRVVQEALMNVAKHAGTKSATVTLRPGPGRVLLRVEDEGAGFDADAVLGGEGEKGFGVRSMRDRVVFMGGRFSLRSAPGAGTTLEVEIDLEG